MLCIVIAWLALLLFLVYQSHVLKSRKATLFYGLSGTITKQEN